MRHLPLPNILIYQIILPLLAPFADLFFVRGLYFNDADGRRKISLYYGVFLLVDMAVSLLAFSFDRKNPLKLLWMLPQRLFYRQLIYVILFRSIRHAIKGEGQGWGNLKRTGNVRMNEPTATI